MGISETTQESGDDDVVIMRILDLIEADSTVTQRSLAKELGVALGLAHAYLRRCVRKGYVKISQIPSRRYAYYVTPHGFSEKSRLTAEFFHQSFRLFRVAREQCAQAMAECEGNGWHRIGLAGIGDVAEVAVLSGAGRAVHLVGIVDPGRAGRPFLGLPVVAEPSQLAGGIDAVIVTSMDQPQATYDSLCAVMPAARVRTLPFMKVRRVPVAEEVTGE